jgi:8-oxo-dGTP pyrophosphatase MutT (NUDIX family)
MVIRYFSLVITTLFTLSSALYADGAGLLPIFDDGTTLSGKEYRSGAFLWNDFGGQQEPHEALSTTAYREFIEETGYYSFPHVKLADVQNAPFVDHIHPIGTYRIYFVPVAGPKPSIQDIIHNGNRAKHKFGRNAHVEKVDYAYIPAHHLISAALVNAPFPGTNEEMFGPFRAILKHPLAHNALLNPQRPAPVVPPSCKRNASKNHKSHSHKKHASKHRSHSHKRHASKKQLPWRKAHSFNGNHGAKKRNHSNKRSHRSHSHHRRRR